ncbi:MAG: N-acetyltransferase family protein [Chthoniobacterales bacterium]
MTIRRATDSDRDAIWEIFREVITASETYPINTNIPRENALAYWFQRDAHVYVAEQNLETVGQAASFPGTLTASPAAQSQTQHRHVVGSYSLHPNQSGGGAHVANAGFIVTATARGQGIGRAMGEHCLCEARRLRFRAMQFNFVVSTNDSAVRLWQELGMQIVGTLPSAFRHPTKGYVDVYVMFRSLL